jgi:hypothetical protein
VAWVARGSAMRYGDVARKLASRGCEVVSRRGKGSHRVWHNPANGRLTTVPDWRGGRRIGGPPDPGSAPGHPSLFGTGYPIHARVLQFLTRRRFSRVYTADPKLNPKAQKLADLPFWVSPWGLGIRRDVTFRAGVNHLPSSYGQFNFGGFRAAIRRP